MARSKTSSVRIDRRPPLCVITVDRPEVRNAVDRPTAEALARAFRNFENDDALAVAILTGAGEHFCAGADLAAFAGGDPDLAHRIAADGDAPMGPTRMQLAKPVIAAVDGYCVAGGLELALWCDLRVASDRAVFGVFCRRFGVPLIDGGSVRLPRLVGMSRALDMILTGRPVAAAEALSFGLANRVVPAAELMPAAERLALELAAFPQTCLRGDRLSAYRQWGMEETAAIAEEFRRGLDTLASGEAQAGAGRFRDGAGRHGAFSRRSM
jgi:enoyl-CoA hydratase